VIERPMMNRAETASITDDGITAFIEISSDVRGVE